VLHRALRLMRLFHRQSQTDLARQLGLSNSYLSEIESGVKKPGLDVLEKYSSVFNIPVSSILLFSEQMDSGTKGAKLKFGATNKVLQILEWIAASDSTNAHAGN
jgi:transcriptional regulator with XRE-family HTH domain